MPDDKLTKDGEQAIKTVAKGGGIVFVGLILSRFFEYIYRMILARFLGPNDYGIISLGLSVLGFLLPIALLGFQHGIKRYVAFYKGKEKYVKIRDTVFSGTVALLFTSILIALLIFFGSNFLAIKVFHEPSLSIILKIFAFVLPLRVLPRVFIGATDAFQKMKYGVLSRDFFGKLSKILMTFAFLAFGLKILGATYAYLISFGVTTTLSFSFFYTKIFSKLRIKKRIKTNYRELLSYSWPLLFTGILASLMGWTDIFMIGYFKDAAQVGIYNVALPTAILLMTFLRAINRITFPVISELFSKDKLKELERTYKVGTRWVLSFTFPMFLLMLFFSPQILSLFFGEEYIAAALPLSILAFAYFFQTSIGSSGEILKSIEKTKIVLINTLAAASLNVGLNYLMIPRFGLEGAAVATGSSLIFISALSLLETHHFLGIHPYESSLYKPVLAALISTSSTYLLFDGLFKSISEWMLFPAFGLFLVLYAALFLLFRGLEREDILILKSIEKKTGIKVKWLRNLIKKFIG